MQYKSNWKLKNLALESLRGNYPEAILLTFLYGLFSFAQTTCVMILTSLGDDFQGTLENIVYARMVPSGFLMGIGVSLFFNLILGLLSVGVSLFYLNMACKVPYSQKNLFHAFCENPLKYLAVTLVQVLITFFFSIPGYVCDYFYLLSESSRWMMLGYACQIIGQLASFPLILGLSQSYRILLDYPSLSAAGAMKKSFRLMNGHKARLFWLNVTFLPLEILAIMTAGIGSLWLTPYIHMTHTLFYLDLAQNTETSAVS